MSILFCIFVLSKETKINNPQDPEGHQDNEEKRSN